MGDQGYTRLHKKIRRMLKNAARFYRVDLHCHTSLSCVKEGVALSKATPKAMAQAACGAGTYLLGVTDHNRSENAPLVAAAADAIRRAGDNLYLNNKLTVLPGMEIDVEENGKRVHVLAIFEAGTPPAEIEHVIDGSGIEAKPEERTENSMVTRKRLCVVIDEIQRRGGLAILAHVNSANGYREEMRDLLSDEEILEAMAELRPDAIEVGRPGDAAHFVHDGVPFACLIGSDAHEPQKMQEQKHVSRIKMAEPSFQHLKRALRDPLTRLRFDDPDRQLPNYVLGVHIDGGFLDGEMFPLTPNLNCLIGGRGSGKSTLIEALRFAFEHEPPELRGDEVKRMRNSVLKGAVVTVLFTTRNRRTYVVRRGHGDPEAQVLQLDGTPVLDLELGNAKDLGITVYGWSEIEGIARDIGQQLDLIDGFVEDARDLKEKVRESLSDLTENGTRIGELQENLERTAVPNLSELEDELKDLGEDETQAEKHQTKVIAEISMLSATKEAAKEAEQTVADLDVTGPLTRNAASLREALEQDEVLCEEQMQRLLAVLADAVSPDGTVDTGWHCQKPNGFSSATAITRCSPRLSPNSGRNARDSTQSWESVRGGNRILGAIWSALFPALLWGCCLAGA